MFTLIRHRTNEIFLETFRSIKNKQFHEDEDEKDSSKRMCINIYINIWHITTLESKWNTIFSNVISMLVASAWEINRDEKNIEQILLNGPFVTDRFLCAWEIMSLLWFAIEISGSYVNVNFWQSRSGIMKNRRLRGARDYDHDSGSNFHEIFNWSKLTIEWEKAK